MAKSLVGSGHARRLPLCTGRRPPRTQGEPSPTPTSAVAWRAHFPSGTGIVIIDIVISVSVSISSSISSISSISSTSSISIRTSAPPPPALWGGVGAATMWKQTFVGFAYLWPHNSAAAEFIILVIVIVAIVIRLRLLLMIMILLTSALRVRRVPRVGRSTWPLTPGFGEGGRPGRPTGARTIAAVDTTDHGALSCIQGRGTGVKRSHASLRGDAMTRLSLHSPRSLTDKAHVRIQTAVKT